MFAPPDAIWQGRAIQGPNFLLNPAAIDGGFGRRDGKLCGEGECCARLLLFGAIGIVFGLETLEVEFDVALGHAQALVPQKLFDGVDINALLNHLRGNRMAKLMSCDGVGLAFMQQMGS